MIRVCIAAVAAGSGVSSAAQVFTGLDLEFSKAAFADHTLAENQDRITDNVWLTRADTMGIFNIAVNDSFQGSGAGSPSPVGTRWAFGSASDWMSLTFGTWGDVHGGSPPSLLNEDLVLHLVDDDIYLDVRFIEWGIGGGAGGSFTYERSIIPAPAGFAALALGGLGVVRRRR